MTTSKICFLFEKDEDLYLKIFEDKTVVLVRDANHLNEWRDYLLVANKGPRFPGYNIYDISIVEKCLFVEKTSTFRNLSQYYLHKDVVGEMSIKETLNLMEKIYIAQSREVNVTGQRHAVAFEIGIYKVMNEIDPSYIPIDRDVLNTDIDKGEKYHKELYDPNFSSRYDLQSYLDKNFDVGTNMNGRGAYDLRHDTLLSYNDEKLKRYVYADKAQWKLNFLYRIKENLNKINGNYPFSHNVYETVTGRMGSLAVQINKKYYEHLPQLSSLDYTSFEMMIYLEYFKPEVYKKFLSTGDYDFYTFMYQECTGKQEVSEASRNGIKKMILSLLNGATMREIAYQNHKTVDGIRKFLTAIISRLEFEENRQSLMNFIIKNRRYSVCPMIGKSFADKYTLEYKNHLINEQHVINSIQSGMSKTALDRYHLSELSDCRKILLKKCMAARIQGTASIIIKQAVKRIHSKLKGTNAKVLLIRYDEIIFENATPEILEMCKLEMQGAYHDIMNSVISVK